LQRLAHFEVSKSIADEHLKQAKKFRFAIEVPLNLLLKKLSKIDEKTPEDILKLEGLSIYELFEIIFKSAKTLDTMVKIERLALGMPTDISQNDIDLNVDKDKLKLYGDLIAEDEETVKKFAELLGSFGNAENSKSGEHGISSIKR
jgi:hypothetical protein